MNDTLFLTVQEMARIFRVTDRTIVNRAEKGLYPGATRIGGDLLFDREAVEAALGRKLPDPKKAKS